jgi:hypothetical protein
MMIHIVVFWVVVLCNDENGGSKAFINVGILPHHFRVSTQKN